MKIPIILAHGTLGNFDEVIFIGVAGIFLVMMGISWVKSRTTKIAFNDVSDASEKSEPKNKDSDEDSIEGEHFRLD